MSHQQYSTTLKQMVGQVLSIKPSLAPTLAVNFINDAIRVMLDRRPNWSGMVRHKSLYIPPIVNSGTVTMAQGSDAVVMTGATWPVSDVVNTTVAAPVQRTGLQVVVPASMTGIDVDTLLYIDSGGNPEVVAVKSITASSFMAKFTGFHNPGFTVTSSSYAGRQFKLGATYPVYTVTAVTTTASLLIDQKWLAADFTSGYSIAQLYYTIDPGLKSLISVIDQSQGIPPLRINLPVQYLDRIDPQRIATGYPQILAAKFPNENGNMQYELWPSPQSARQLSATYTQQPAQLQADDDFLPDFLNPTVVFYYAASMALATRSGQDDIYYDPVQSNRYMGMFDVAFGEMTKADDEKAASGVQWNSANSGIGGATWWQSHDPSVLWGPF